MTTKEKIEQDLNNLGQRIEGEVQKVQGNVEVATGDTLEGRKDQILGSAKVLASKVSANVEKARK
jgi:uncharacterized protein YjbJ (UPF0337 family)